MHLHHQIDGLSQRHRSPITPQITTSTPHHHPIIEMLSDYLTSSEHSPPVASQLLYVVAQRLELLNYLHINTFLNIDGRIRHLAICTGHTRSNADPRRVECVLGIELEDFLIEENLYVTLWLHEAAHDAEDAVQ